MTQASQTASDSDLLLLSRTVFEIMREGVLVIDAESRVAFVNQAFFDILGLPPDLGRSVDHGRAFGLLRDRLREPERLFARMREMSQSSEAELRDQLEFTDGRLIEFHARSLRREGRTIGRFWVFQDRTAERSAEAERREAEYSLRQTLADQERLISTIHEMGTPVLPIHDRVLVVPLVGHLDTLRSAHLTDALLIAITQHQAEVVLLDITGVAVVDTAVASSLLQTTRACNLLGARCVLVGVSAQVARSLVFLGADLAQIVTRRDLQAGITYALKELGYAIRRDVEPVDWLAELAPEPTAEDIEEEGLEAGEAAAGGAQASA